MYRGTESFGDYSAISPKQHDMKGQNETPHEETTNIRSGATFRGAKNSKHENLMFRPQT